MQSDLFGSLSWIHTLWIFIVNRFLGLGSAQNFRLGSSIGNQIILDEELYTIYK